MTSRRSLASAADTVRSLTRRRLLQWAGGGLSSSPLLHLLTCPAASAADKYESLHRFPRMVQEFFVEQVRASQRSNLAMLDRLKSKSDAEKYVLSVREKIRKCFGPEPERTPLNSRVTGIVERDGYRIEKVIFESRPGFPVTANLYLPASGPGPFPGVIGSCGHSANGKAAEAYQAFSQGLARLGFACLIYDPIGQGERLQYTKEDLTPVIGPGVSEHLHAGNQQFLVGEFLGMWRAWDGIRALDYLLTREDIDKQHLGVTGNSGGGTMTTWLCGLERRWTMGAPSCFVTTFLHNMENELPADTEQCPPLALSLHLDHADFLAAMAPHPVIILAKERDFFDARGSEEAYQRLRKIYQLLEAEEHVGLFIGPTGHGYSQENREAMYSWFQRSAGRPADRTVAGAGTSPPRQSLDGHLETAARLPYQPEPSIVIEKDETLWCTPRGQVAELPQTRTVFSFTREKARSLAEHRPQLSGEDLRRAVIDVLKLPPAPPAPPDYRILRPLGSRGYPSKGTAVYVVETEPGIQAVVYRLTSEAWYSRPPQAGARAILYVAHLSSDAELREESLIREIISQEPDVPVFACDVRGIGESQPDTCGQNSFHSAYGSDYFYAIHSLMLDRPYLGQKTYDVLRVLNWLESLGHTDIHLVGVGWGALAATFAGLLSERVHQVTLKNSLTSYAEIADTEHYHWPLSALLPNVLERFDLPDCYRELKPKQLRSIDPWGASGKPAAT